MSRRELAILAALALAAALAGYVLAEALSLTFLGLPLSVRRVP